MGRDPVAYYDYRVGHILHLSPAQMGDLTPGDLMGAVSLYAHRYLDG